MTIMLLLCNQFIGRCNALASVGREERAETRAFKSKSEKLKFFQALMCILFFLGLDDVYLIVLLNFTSFLVSFVLHPHPLICIEQFL